MPKNVADDALHAAVRAIAEDEISSGRELGLQIVAYLHGEKIVDVCAGAVRLPDGTMRSVTPEVRFMAYSVAKGVSSAIISRSIESSRGRVKYSDAVSRHWPDFAAGGKEKITIAEALSHRAGLRARSLCALSTIRSMLRGNYDAGMATGIAWMAASTPSWRSRKYARYHPTSWSWIAGGLYAYLADAHIQEGAAALAHDLGVSAEHLRIGELDPTCWAEDLAPMAVPPASQPFTAWRHATWHAFASVRGVRSALWLPMALAAALFIAIFGWLESVLWVAVANWSVFLAICLPSSNGVFTARALGGLYGALANGGKLTDGTVVLGKAMAAELRRGAQDSSADVSGWPDPARLTYGFSPWLGGLLEKVLTDRMAATLGVAGSGEKVGRLAILGHQGMGGCCAYADMTSGLAIAVLKNAFSPECINGGGPGRVAVLVDACLRERFGLVGGTTSTAGRTEHTTVKPTQRPARSPARRSSRAEPAAAPRAAVRGTPRKSSPYAAARS